MTDLVADPAAFLQRLVLQLPALLIAVTVHELAHALVADRLGDPTARSLGRLTLNPLPHIDPLGALAFILVLGIFNLIPLPPLDGGHFLPYLLPRGAAGALHGLERYGMLVLLVLVFTGIIQRILGPVFL